MQIRSRQIVFLSAAGNAAEAVFSEAVPRRCDRSDMLVAPWFVWRGKQCQVPSDTRLAVTRMQSDWLLHGFFRLVSKGYRSGSSFVPRAVSGSRTGSICLRQLPGSSAVVTVNTTAVVISEHRSVNGMRRIACREVRSVQVAAGLCPTFLVQ